MSRGLTLIYASITMRGFFAKIAQLVEHRTENAGVPSSSLGLGKEEKPVPYEPVFYFLYSRALRFDDPARAKYGAFIPY